MNGGQESDTEGEHDLAAGVSPYDALVTMMSSKRTALGAALRQRQYQQHGESDINDDSDDEENKSDTNSDSPQVGVL